MRRSLLLNNFPQKITHFKVKLRHRKFKEKNELTNYRSDSRKTNLENFRNEKKNPSKYLLERNNFKTKNYRLRLFFFETD